MSNPRIPSLSDNDKEQTGYLREIEARDMAGKLNTGLKKIDTQRIAADFCDLTNPYKASFNKTFNFFNFYIPDCDAMRQQVTDSQHQLPRFGRNAEE